MEESKDYDNIIESEDEEAEGEEFVSSFTEAEIDEARVWNEGVEARARKMRAEHARTYHGNLQYRHDHSIEPGKDQMSHKHILQAELRNFSKVQEYHGPLLEDNGYKIHRLAAMNAIYSQLKPLWKTNNGACGVQHLS